MMRCFSGSCLVGCLGLALGLADPARGQTQGETGSASEKAARRIEELLQPGNKTVDAPGIAPVQWPAAKAVDQPQLPPAVYTGMPPPPPVSRTGRAAGPRPFPEGQPPIGDGKPPLAKPIELPTQPLIQLPAIDVESPLPIPILARPKQDRATLEDTTLETSHAATMGPVRPRRTQRVPFAPLNLPDPFENIRNGGLRNPPEENQQPPAIPVRTPKQ